MKTGNRLSEFRAGPDFGRRVFFVGDEGLLMTADGGRMTVRSNLDAAPVTVTLPGMRVTETDHVVMTPDGRTIAVTWGDSLFRWSLAEGPRRAPAFPGFGTGVA